MKKIYLITFMCFLPMFLTSQIMITEKYVGEELNASNYNLDFIKENYETYQINVNEKIYILKEEFINTNKTENVNDEVILTLNLQNHDPQFVVVLILDENGYEQDLEIQNQNSVQVNLPSGTYDVIVSFHTNEGTKYVIKELVEINENTSLVIDMLDAKNRVVYNSYNDNGELIQSDVNTSFQLTSSGIVYIPTNTNFSSTITWNGTAIPHFRVDISNVSDRYGIFHSSYSVGYNGKIYVPDHQFATGISGNVEFVNSSTDWIEFQENAISPSASTEESNGDVWKALGLVNTINGYRTSVRAFMYLEDFNYDEDLTYVFNKEMNNIHNTLISPSHFETVNNLNYYSIGNTLSASPSEIIYGDGITSGINNIDILERMKRFNGKAKYYPFHEKFSYSSVNNSTYTQGNTVPIFITGFIPSSMFYNFYLTPIGRSGEIHESHFLYTNAKVYNNSNLLFEGSLENMHLLDYLQPTNEKRIVLTNENTKVDGFIGKNITEIVYTNLHEDKIPPTLQMLQFRDDNNKIKERFAIGEYGTLRLSAGDFYYNNIYNSPGYSHFLYQPGNTVQVYYSKYNEENWIELSLTQYPQYFQMPRYGDYYEASLSQITEQGTDIWYDLKVICTDAAGNSQTQIISPAFKLNSTLQTDEIGEEYDFVVYPNPFNENLNIQLPKNIKGDYVVKLTDMTGKLIHSENKKATDSKSLFFSFLPKGVYVLSIESNGKILAKKVIKK